MSMQDPVADMLTRLRNAQTMGIREVTLPYSKLKLGMLNVLKEEGYIESFAELDTNGKKDIHVALKYYEGRPVMEKIKRISRPALRVYRGSQEIPSIRGGLGIAIVSTPKGVMSDKSARALNVGGEVLCTIE
jgi:small subunit ribosomal protein S8